MEDFASAAMMRLVRAGLARQGLDASLERPPSGPHVPLASKREGVEGILREHGPLALLRIAEAMPDLSDAPVLAALDGGADPSEAIARWRRLERYVHSRHRTEVLEDADRALSLRHVSQDPTAPPRRSEDLLIFGVLVALVARVGVRGLRARPLGDAGWAFDGAWRAAPTSGDCSTWRIEWDAVAPAAPGPEAAEPATLSALIRSDPARRWTVAEAARALGRSGRTLQRELKARDTSFSQVAADVRAALAVHRLEQGELSLGEIGFLCGYADQAHFTRSFKAAIGAPPHRYRRE